jgi:hypothetical protein
MRLPFLIGLLFVFVAGCKTAPVAVSQPATEAPPARSGYTVSRVALPGGGPNGIGMDALAYDFGTRSVWVPAGNTGSVDVVDTLTGKVTQIGGFPTATFESHGHSRVVGPSSAAVGDGVVFVGNRGDSTICAIDEKSLTKQACGKLDSSPDLIAYVPTMHELWVTTPRDQTIRILDATTLAPKAKLTFEGSPEGTAVDVARGRFYTNLEDKDRTLAIDLTTHQTVATWEPHCGEEGPHGLVLDSADEFLFVACSAKAETLDVGHGGAIVGTVESGDGVDLLDYSPAERRLYVAAGGAATLTVAQVASDGSLSSAAVVKTAPRSRNAVVAANGNVYLADSPGSGLIVVVPPAH